MKMIRYGNNSVGGVAKVGDPLRLTQKPAATTTMAASIPSQPPAIVASNGGAP